MLITFLRARRCKLRGVVTDLSAFLETLGGPAWLADDAGRVSYANTHAHSYKTYPPVHPAEAGRLERGWQHVAQSGAPLNLVLQLGNGQGYRRFDCRLALLDSLRLFTCADIEEREGAREALQERCDRLERFFQSAPLGIALLDRDLRLLEINPALARLGGLSRGDHLGERFGDGMGEKGARILELCREVLRTGRPVLRRELLEKPPGHACWEVNVYPTGEGGETSGLGLEVQDITVRKLAESALHEGELRFRSLVEASAQVVWICDPEGEIPFPQASWSDYTGQTWWQYRDWGWLQAVHPDHRERVARHWRECLREGKVYETEYPLRRHDGEYRYTLARAVPLLDEAGQVREWVGLNADITERKAAEEALKESEAKYRALAETQKRFVSDASHELRAPLTAIQGNLELVQRFKMSQADQEAALAEAAGEAARLGRLVGDLLALARGDAGATLRLERVPLKAVLLEALDGVRRGDQAHHFGVGRLQEVYVQGERDRLKQLATILLNNAVKYTPAGGTVRLELVQSGNRAVFRVQDSGIGIAPQALPHVFERFFRVDESRNHRSGGSGLGLSLARWIVDQHGGGIDIQSQPGVGTTLTVSLPLQQP